MDLWEPAVFLLAAGVVMVGTLLLAGAVWPHRQVSQPRSSSGEGGLRPMLSLLREPGRRPQRGGEPGGGRSAG
ncbi:hypothetical protein [Actinomycetospora soli]|uniref:hypothetical protein n=1 Tax=Actinomycetospora soli TaxID=2893887 RepID=UPI001E41F924|nr:hypothetical protein [Actinomycetospora soli]MCD2191137.1 hypothetical protein [Actinomycetospora soli]